MRGLMPFIAFAIVGTWALIVLGGLAGVAVGGYWLITSDVGSSRYSRNSSSSRGVTPPQSSFGQVSTPSFSASTPPPSFTPPPSITQRPSFTNPNPAPKPSIPEFTLPSLPSTPKPNLPTRPTPTPSLPPGFPERPDFKPPTFTPPSFPRPTGGMGVNPPTRPGTIVEGLEENANSNKLLKRFAGQLKIQASSEWTRWPAKQAIDGNVNTSWFPTVNPKDRDGSWLLLTFPEDVLVDHLSILGNRDSTRRGYSIKQLQVELLSESGKVLLSKTATPTKGVDYDFPGLNCDKVRQIRLLILQDQFGRKGVGQMAAIGEIQAE